jgi:hypothetical protein
VNVHRKLSGILAGCRVRLFIGTGLLERHPGMVAPSPAHMTQDAMYAPPAERPGSLPCHQAVGQKAAAYYQGLSGSQAQGYAQARLRPWVPYTPSKIVGQYAPPAGHQWAR